MTRIFTDGAEMGDVLAWTSATGAWTVATSSPTPRTGNYYYKASNSGDLIKSVNNLTEVYVRHATQLSAFQTSEKFPVFRKGATDLAWLAIDSENHFAAYSSVGLLEDSNFLFSLNRWYLIEVYFKLDDAPNGRFIVYVDGIKIIDFTGDTLTTANTTFDYVVWRRSNGTHCLDDIAINDTNGIDDNSWCGDGHVVKITPSGSSTTNNWLNSGSVSGSANYLYVDDFPNDSDTSYIYASGSSAGVRDQYAMSSFDGTNKSITRIYSESRVRKTQAVESTKVKTGYLPSGGTVQLSGSSALLLDYSRIVGDEAIVNPVTDSPWTEDDINELEYAIEIV
jgi:hypothetical protein